jgi:lysophospholipase
MLGFPNFMIVSLALSVFNPLKAQALNQTTLLFTPEHESQRREIEVPKWTDLNLYYRAESLPAKLLEVSRALVTAPTYFTSTCSAPVKIHYMVINFDERQFPRGGIPPKGPVVILPGRGEPALKYIEASFDLFQKGYGPIYALDHRGQGLSDRLDFSVVNKRVVQFPQLRRSPYINHLDSFECYISDFKQFLDEVVLRFHAIDEVKIIAHSTGATIVAGFLNNSARSLTPVPVKIAYLSPMFGIDSIDNAITQILKDPMGSLSSYWKIMNCLPEDGCMDIAKDGLFNRALDFDTMNVLTRSKERFLYYHLAMNFWPQAITESLTTGWIQESRRYLNELYYDRQKAPNTEILAFKAGDDLVIDNESIDQFCDDRQASFKSCEVDSSFKLSFHSMLIEKDDVRQALLEKIDAFFQKR